jgi:hypothetical protein
MSLTPRLDTIQRNHIINGDMSIAQRYPGNPGATITSSGTQKATYADRFSHYCQGSTAKSFNVGQNNSVPSLSQSGNYVLQCISITNEAAFTLSDPADLVQPIYYIIEGYDYQRLHGKIVTLGFWFQSNLAGVYGVSFSGYRNYNTTFTVTTPNVWNFYSITVQLDNISSWEFDNGPGLAIIFCPIGGSDYVSSTLNQWFSAGDFVVVPSTASPWNTTVGATFQLTMVSLVEGPSLDPTSFHLSSGNFAGELLSCLRYCWAPTAQNPNPGGGFMPAYGITNTFAAMGNFPVPMRTTPSFNVNPAYINFTPASGGSIALNTWTGDTRTSQVGYYITGTLQSNLSVSPVGGILTTVSNAASMIFDCEL